MKRFCGSNILKNHLRKEYSNVLLMGPPGCGKTTIGRIIAPLLQKNWIDVDDDFLEPRWKMSVADKLNQVGDERFLELEEKEICHLDVSDSVVSLSGSVPLRCDGLKHLSKDGLIVYLDTSIQSIVDRLEKMKVDRIVGHKNRRLYDVLQERFEIYEKSYDIRVVIGKDDTPEEIANNVLNAIKSRSKDKYFSTRGNDNEQSFHHVLLSGLAKDKGLYLPESFLKFNGEKELERMIELKYDEVCSRVIEKFPTIAPWRISECTKEGYSSFSHPDILPLSSIGNMWMLETFHGPTASFKDLSLQILPKLFKHSAEDNNEERKPSLLVATSGDTGSAALDGFGRTEGTPIIVLYPFQGVSSVQQAQMVRAPGNVCVLGVHSDFDFCQKTVKNLLGSDTLSNKYSWTSANSINFGRLLPQACFTVQSYLSLVKKNVISIGDPIDVTIPTGNFGNIFSATIAKRMGIPIRRLICASNENNVLTKFINNGIYSITDRKFKTTISPAIDILISSNLERWIYMLLKDNSSISHEKASSEVSSLMNNLSSNGYFNVSKNIHDKISDIMIADWCSEKECLETIKNVWNEHNTLIDPHSAVGYHVASKFNDPDVPMVIMSTAHWAKFPEAIIEALSSNNPSPNNVSSQFNFNRTI